MGRLPRKTHRMTRVAVPQLPGRQPAIRRIFREGLGLTWLNSQFFWRFSQRSLILMLHCLFLSPLRYSKRFPGRVARSKMPSGVVLRIVMSALVVRRLLPFLQLPAELPRDRLRSRAIRRSQSSSVIRKLVVRSRSSFRRRSMSPICAAASRTPRTPMGARPFALAMRTPRRSSIKIRSARISTARAIA